MKHRSICIIYGPQSYLKTIAHWSISLCCESVKGVQLSYFWFVWFWKPKMCGYLQDKMWTIRIREIRWTSKEWWRPWFTREWNFVEIQAVAGTWVGHRYILSYSHITHKSRWVTSPFGLQFLDLKWAFICSFAIGSNTYLIFFYCIDWDYPHLFQLQLPLFMNNCAN